MIKLWEAGKIEKPLAPILPDLTLRGFGDFHLGERTADAKERDTIRKRKHSDWMADVSDNPEKYSPVVSFTDMPKDMVGQKIECGGGCQTGRVVGIYTVLKGLSKRSFLLQRVDQTTLSFAYASTLLLLYSGTKNLVTKTPMCR
jgi:hypothetical protein